MPRPVVISLFASIFLLTHVPAARSAEEREEYQLMKATENTVWRLNKITGEIAVCTLAGTELVCTTTAEALSPTEAEEKRRLGDAARKAAKQQQTQRELAMLDRILQFVRDLIGMAAENP